MSDLILTTWNWVLEGPPDYVRDLRVRWALEEAALPYRVENVSPDERKRHLAHQPFGQIPWLTDGKAAIFESGAILLYPGERSEALMPTEPGTRAEALSWVIAALNSMEPPFLAWVSLSVAHDPFASDGARAIASSCDKRLKHLEAVLAKRGWLAGGFSAADILMTEALRPFDGSDVLADFPASRAYVARATARPAFRKAHADQLAHFAAAVRGCPGCAMFADSLPHLAHLQARNTSLVMVSPVPLAEIAAFKARMGWTMPWVESRDAFNADFGVTGGFGLNVFLRENGTIWRTYFTSGRGVESLGSVWSFLDLTPYGRQEIWQEAPKATPYQWWHLHDEYGEAKGGGCVE